MASPTDEQSKPSRVDLLVDKQAEIDDLRLELQRTQVRHSAHVEDYLETIERRKLLLVDAGEICRRLMEVPEVWDAVPDIGQLLVRLREELGPDADGEK